MLPYWTLNGSELYQEHVLDVLRGLETGSIHMAATSPPYWGLRDYGLPPVEWPAVSYAPMAGLPSIEVPGCDSECNKNGGHVWGEERITTAGRKDAGNSSGNFNPHNKDHGPRKASQGQFCQLCGGWRGSLGLEPTIEMFVGHLVLVWRELWRVLRDDGTCWLNLGDSYAQNGGKRATAQELDEDKQRAKDKGYWSDAYAGYKGWDRSAGTASPSLPAKNLIGVPWRVALALQADGWYLRSDIIWAKGVSFCSTYSGSCMPESVRDRPTKGHEYVFLLSKNKRYYYDQEAVREAHLNSSIKRWGNGGEDTNNTKFDKKQPKTGVGNLRNASNPLHPAGRNLRSVWLINPGSYAGAHFATFPPVLVEPMILAGTSAKGCCPECGAPWVRVTERTAEINPSAKGSRFDKGKTGTNGNGRVQEGEQFLTTTTGWRPTCTCSEQEPVPCTVLDPFGGSGTVGAVAIQHRRRAILIELSKVYCDDHIIPRLEKPLQMEMAL